MSKQADCQRRTAPSEGERSEPERSTVLVPSAEVREKPERRRFSAEYKLRMAEAAERCVEPGKWALVQRESLYFSHFTQWRKQYREEALRGSREKARGRKARPKKPLAERVEELERLGTRKPPGRTEGLPCSRTARRATTGARAVSGSGASAAAGVQITIRL